MMRQEIEKILNEKLLPTYIQITTDQICELIEERKICHICKEPILSKGSMYCSAVHYVPVHSLSEIKGMMEAIILGGRNKAREVFQSEIFTLNQYLKDEEMKDLHGKRFYKMLAAMQTAIRIFDWLDEPREDKG